MTDRQAGPEADDDHATEAAGSGHPGLPGWVKLSAIVVAILVVAAIAIMLVAGGEHGPARHGGGQAVDSLESQLATGGLVERLESSDRPAG